MMMIVLRLLSLLGLKSRCHRDFSPRLLNEVFSQGAGIAGIVESWPKTLVPSASDLSTPEWSLVESAKGEATKSNVVLVRHQEGNAAGRDHLAGGAAQAEE